jgi:predicted DNA-binding antitoxin AbrB/MazE fold protein
MTRVTEAVFSNGVLTPVENLGLQENQRVRLIVDCIDSPPDRAAALTRLKAGIASMGFFSTGSCPTREELHDRRSYRP